MNIKILISNQQFMSFAMTAETYKSLEASKGWSDVYEVKPKDFKNEISPYFNPTRYLFGCFH